MRLVLASASPRRKELLKEIYTPFEICPALGEEKAQSRSPELLVQSLARAKAKEVFDRLGDLKAVVLGSDTVVVYDGEVLGKPKDEADAKRMLFALSGNVHKVMTGVCFFYTDRSGKVREKSDVGITEVKFNQLTEAFIDEYVKSGSPMDKAGAYGIQDGGLVEKIDGSYSCVVGLPVELCKRLFAEIKEVVL